MAIDPLPDNVTALAEAFGGVDDDAEPMGPRLALPRVRVTMADGQVLEAQAYNPDFLRWDRTAAKHGWPDMRKVPVTWLTFVAWSALRRSGAIPDSMTWDAFSETHALQVESISTEADAVGPTLPGPEPG